MSDREPRYRNTQVLEGNAGADYTHMRGTLPA